MTVSVVIPLYNAKDVVRDTLRSVRAQTLTDYEVVIVDDGSTDGSGDVVQAAAPWARYLRQANAGVAAARNRGIAESHGAYIALLDHDDLWHPTKLAKQAAVLDERPDVGMAVTDVVHIDRNGRETGEVGVAYNPHDHFARLFVRGFVPTPSATLIRRSVFDAVGGLDESFGSAGMDDHELWTRIAARYAIAHVAEGLTYHRHHADKPSHIGIEHRGILIERLLARYGDDLERQRYLLQERAAYWSDLGRWYVAEGRVGEGRELLQRGLRASLGSPPSLKTAWRCLGRLLRSYAVQAKA